METEMTERDRMKIRQLGISYGMSESRTREICMSDSIIPTKPRAPNMRKAPSQEKPATATPDKKSLT
jgi:hypothetical protein